MTAQSTTKEDTPRFSKLRKKWVGGDPLVCTFAVPKYTGCEIQMLHKEFLEYRPGPYWGAMHLFKGYVEYDRYSDMPYSYPVREEYEDDFMFKYRLLLSCRDAGEFPFVGYEFWHNYGKNYHRGDCITVPFYACLKRYWEVFPDIYVTPLEEMPLWIPRDYQHLIAQWRLKVGK